MPPQNDLPLLSLRFTEALTWAAQLHQSQVRKGSPVPYVAHLLGVASLVLEAGGDEDETIAALLHDAAEDQGGLEVLAEIRSRFGERVAAIVDGCTDTYLVPKPPWRQRKEAYLAHLREAGPEVRLVSLADKLHNARSILRDLRVQGSRVFEKFNGGRDGTLWYYSALAQAFRELEEGFMVDELERVVGQIWRLAESTRPPDELSLDRYQEYAARTSGAGGEGHSRLIIAALGLAGEAGEFANDVKKLTAHGHQDITPGVLADELGDVLWYLAEAASAIGLTLDGIGWQNIEKLRQRYPGGFSQERSINRRA